jgi:hypothetical protein
MPINPPIQGPATVYQALDLIIDAMIEIGMLAPGEDDNVDPSTAQWAFRKLNYRLDEWAAEDVFVYSEIFDVFQLIANHTPHTIGPGNGLVAADFSVEQRPVLIAGASLLLPGTGGNVVDTPIDVEDDDWWQENPVKTLTSTLPTHLYYSPDNPNGNCYFWPSSTIAYQVRLRIWTVLRQFQTINDPIDGSGGSGILPPAYRTALMLSLAEDMQTPAGKQADASLAQRAMKARAAVMGNNQGPPRISTIDGGMPSAQKRQKFNFLTREPW